MGYICCLGGFIEPSKSLGGKYEPSEKFRGQKQTLFLFNYQSNFAIDLVFCGSISFIEFSSRFIVSDGNALEHIEKCTVETHLKC
jgi:hypothetical protein